MPRRDTEDPLTEALTFPKPCHKILRQLAANNDREWFAAHRDDYHVHVLEPSRAFVVAAGKGLRRFAPTVNADPRANGQGSISRIQRDVRFSADQTPYRTFLGILFWQGTAARKWDSPSFHLILQPGRVKLSAGIRGFSPVQLERWRTACGDGQLRKLLRRLDAANLELGGMHYKRVPRGLEPKDDDHAALLRHKGLFVVHKVKIKTAFHGEEFLAFCIETWRAMAPLNRWLEQLG